MGHELIVTLPSEPIWLYADPIRLAQVVGNLLNNACKFTEKGGRIRLSVEREGEQAVIRVRDNGMGIAADQLPLSSTCSCRPTPQWSVPTAGWVSDWH